MWVLSEPLSDLLGIQGTGEKAGLLQVTDTLAWFNIELIRPGGEEFLLVFDGHQALVCGHSLGRDGPWLPRPLTDVLASRHALLAEYVTRNLGHQAGRCRDLSHVSGRHFLSW